MLTYRGETQACVANVVATFESGAGILQRIKQRRSASGLPPLPQFLEDSISSAADEIQRECTRGVVRCGDQFEAGDFQAVLALQQITTQLHNNLLNRLRDIEDGEGDVAALADAADTGRDRTMTTLIGLRQRLAQHPATRVEAARTMSDLSTMSIASPVTPRSPPFSPPQLPQTASPQTVPQVKPPGPPPVPAKNYDHGHGQARPSFGSPPGGQRFTFQHVEQDQFEIRRAESYRNADVGRSGSVYTPYPRPSSASGSSMATQGTGQSSLNETSTASPQPHRLNHVPFNQHPTKANDYLGFCKSAWKLQCGDEKGLVKAKDFSHSAQSDYHFKTCSKFRCEFKGHGVEVVTNKPIVDLNRGMKYRWSFLAKSHVFMKSAANEEYSYLCMFCVFSGQKGVVYNVNGLLDHISNHHCDERMSEVILDRTDCIQGRVCRDSEKFDVNLFPTAAPDVPRDSGIYRPFPSDKMRPGEVVVELSARKSSEVQKVFELNAA